MLKFESLQAQLKNVQPLQNQIALESVRWVKPEIHASRNAQGVINWLGLSAPAAPAPAKPEEVDKAQPVASPAKSEKPAKPLAIAVQQFDIEGGVVHWRDAATGAAPAALTLAPLAVQVKNVAWPMKEALSLTASTNLQAGDDAQHWLLQLREADPRPEGGG